MEPLSPSEQMSQSNFIKQSFDIYIKSKWESLTAQINTDSPHRESLYWEVLQATITLESI